VAHIHNSSTNQDRLIYLVPNKGKHQQQHRLAPHHTIQTNNTAKVNTSIRHIITLKAKLQTPVPIQMAGEHLNQPLRQRHHMEEDITTTTFRHNRPSEQLQIR